LAGSAFKDAEVIKALSNFTPIIVDGDVEKDVCKKFGAAGYPHTVFADAKGASVKVVGGYVETPVFLQAVQAAAKKAKPGAPSKDYATLTGAKLKLDVALSSKKTQIAPALAAIAEIEKVNRPGAILDAALAAKKQLLEDGQKRLDAAKASAKTDKDAALKELKALAKDYKGADIGAEAAKLVKEMEPPPDAGK
jgi:hypothetical protein